MKRLRLRVSPQDGALVQAQGSTRRSYKPFAQAFGTKRDSEARAALIVTSVNCHNHLIVAVQTIHRMTQRPINGNGRRLQTRMALIARHAGAALKWVKS